MSCNIIANDHTEGRNHTSLNPEFVDFRVLDCPECGSGGMNTCYGYWAFECGREIAPDGDLSKDCKAPKI